MDYSAWYFVSGLWGLIELINLLQRLNAFFAGDGFSVMSKNEFLQSYSRSSEKKKEDAKSEKDGDAEHVLVIRTKRKTDIDRIKSMIGNIEIVNEEYFKKRDGRS